MNNPTLDTTDFKHSRDLMYAADYIIGFERITVPEVEEKPCTFYRCYTDANGEPQVVEIGRCFIGDIEDCGPPEPEPEKIKNWMRFSLPV